MFSHRTREAHSPETAKRTSQKHSKHSQRAAEQQANDSQQLALSMPYWSIMHFLLRDIDRSPRRQSECSQQHGPSSPTSKELIPSPQRNCPGSELGFGTRAADATKLTFPNHASVHQILSDLQQSSSAVPLLAALMYSSNAPATSSSERRP